MVKARWDYCLARLHTCTWTHHATHAKLQTLAAQHACGPRPANAQHMLDPKRKGKHDPDRGASMHASFFRALFSSSEEKILNIIVYL